MQYLNHVTPNDEGIMSSSDSVSIQNAIDKAIENGINKVIIPRYNKRSESFEWIIDSTVLLPDNIYLVLDNCYMRLADDVFCNMFANKNCRTKIGATKEGTNRNITIEGMGKAILDGGKYNGMAEFTYDKENGPHITNNCTLLFSNVEGFVIKNLHFRNQRYWALDFVFCSNGKISDIDFLADHTYIDEDGNESYCLSRDLPRKGVKVQNADGIDIRSGCHDIIIENITGFTEDDTIALTALNKGSTLKYMVDGRDTDIHNIIIRNLMCCSLCAIVRLLNQGGTKIYNVLIDGIMDTSKDFEGLDRGYSGVRIGDMEMYGDRHAKSDETYNIVIRNVFARTIAPLNIVGEMSGVSADNIMSFDRK